VRGSLEGLTPDSEVVVVKSVVLEAPGRLTLRDGPEPGPPGRGEALVRVLRVGICGTDLHAYRGDQAFMRYPIVLGHELAVEIVAIEPPPASAATPAAALRVGDRCTVIPYLADGTCPACRAGRSNCCSTLELYGVHRDGGMRERFVVPLTHLVAANDVDPDLLAVVEMLAVGAHAVARAAVAPHERVLVLGAGPIGLSVLAFVRRRARSVHAFDVDGVRSAFAQGAGLAESIAAEPAPAAGGPRRLPPAKPRRLPPAEPPRRTMRVAWRTPSAPPWAADSPTSSWTPPATAARWSARRTSSSTAVGSCSWATPPAI
jgi:threonine dehydrogenase-like Zn-dependent dehydrogenase